MAPSGAPLKTEASTSSALPPLAPYTLGSFYVLCAPSLSSTDGLENTKHGCNRVRYFQALGSSRQSSRSRKCAFLLNLKRHSKICIKIFKSSF